MVSSLAKLKDNISPDNLARNVSVLLQQNGISESELARALELPYNTIRRILSGVTTDPRLSTLKLIAEYFNLSLDALVSVVPPLRKDVQLSGAPATVPVVEWEDLKDAKFIQSLDKSTWPNWQLVALVSSQSISEHAYAIKSKKSMQPRFPMNTMFIVDPDEEDRDGDLVLVKMKDSHEVSLRELIVDPPDKQLLPISSGFQPLIFNDDSHEIVGVVVYTVLQCRKP